MLGLEKRYFQSDFEDPEDKIKNLMDNFFSSQRPLFSLSEKVWNPPTDVYETSDSIVIKMEIAGVESENIVITIEDNHLVIKGKRSEEPEQLKENFHLMEIHYASFKRHFGLPSKLSLADVKANYKDGFLKVMIPKSEGERKQDISICIE